MDFQKYLMRELQESLTFWFDRGNARSLFVKEIIIKSNLIYYYKSISNNLL